MFASLQKKSVFVFFFFHLFDKDQDQSVGVSQGKFIISGILLKVMSSY
jgi:hypothetical protein